MRANFFELNEIEKDIIYNHMWPVTFFLEYQKQRKGLLRLLPTNIAGHARQVKEDDDERIGEKRFPYPSLEFMSNSFWKGRQYLINSALFICYDEENMQMR